MPKSIRRATVTRTVTFTATIDLPGYPEVSDTNFLLLNGGAEGNTGTLSIAELLSGSIAANGSINRGQPASYWSVTGTSTNVESYISRPPNTPLAVGARVASVSPPAGLAAAVGKMFVVTVAGTTANSSTEPSWNLTDGGTTTDGAVTFRTIPKFPTFINYTVNTAYTVGQIVRPSSSSMREFLVTSGGTSAGTIPVWTNADTAGATLSSNTVVFTSLVNVLTYGQLTTYGLGDIVKPTASSSEEYLVTVAGTTNTTASLSTNAGLSVTIGTATFKRIV